MLVSPAEPEYLRRLGTVSSTCEKVGADFLIHSPVHGAVGVQRKELKDFIASSYDGRLVKEVAQMKVLGLGVLLLEGRVQWTDDGLVLGNYSRWTRSQHLGTIWSIQLAGYWIAQTQSMAETSEWLSTFIKWTSKPRHKGMLSRPGPTVTSVWGKADNRDWGIHLLQSFPGIGADTAGAIYDHFEGVPLSWTVSEKELKAVKGVGSGRASQLLNSLDAPLSYVELDGV